MWTCGRVVGDAEFPVVVGLTTNRIDGVPQPRFVGVEDGQEDADQWPIQPPPCLLAHRRQSLLIRFVKLQPRLVLLVNAGYGDGWLSPCPPTPARSARNLPGAFLNEDGRT